MKTNAKNNTRMKNLTQLKILWILSAVSTFIFVLPTLSG